MEHLTKESVFNFSVFRSFQINSKIFCKRYIIFYCNFPLWTNFKLNLSCGNRNSYTWTIKNVITKKMRFHAVI